MDIKDHGHSISYGIPLTPDVVGRNRANFYRETLSYSARLNGPHIGIENDKVVLTKEDHKAGLGSLGVGRSIRQMHDTHQVAYPEVLKMQKRNGVRFKNKKR